MRFMITLINGQATESCAQPRRKTLKTSHRIEKEMKTIRLQVFDKFTAKTKSLWCPIL